MRRRLRYGRPDRLSLFLAMLLNAVVSSLVLYLVMTLFGVSTIVLGQMAAHGIHTPERWGTVLPMLPGLSIGMGCLWYWLILTGRTRGVAWSGACIYGALLALCNVPVAGLILGALEGEPGMGLLIALLLVLLSPALMFAMLVSGTILGLFNGRLAMEWIAWYRRS